MAARGRPKGTKGSKKTQKNVFTVTAPGEKERTGRYTMSPAAAKQREQVKYPVAKTEEEMTANAQRIEHVIRVQEIATRADRKDILSLKSCFLEYLRLCQADGCCVGNMGAYTAMGFTNSEFIHWSKADIPERREFARFVKSTCALFRETLVTDGKLNPVIGIFWQRNYDGLRNDTEQVQAIQEQDELSGESNSYRKRYGNLIGMESDDK